MRTLSCLILLSAAACLAGDAPVEATYTTFEADGDVYRETILRIPGQWLGIPAPPYTHGRALHYDYQWPCGFVSVDDGVAEVLDRQPRITSGIGRVHEVGAAAEIGTPIHGSAGNYINGTAVRKKQIRVEVCDVA